MGWAEFGYIRVLWQQGVIRDQVPKLLPLDVRELHRPMITQNKPRVGVRFNSVPNRVKLNSICTTPRVGVRLNGVPNCHPVRDCPGNPRVGARFNDVLNRLDN